MDKKNLISKDGKKNIRDVVLNITAIAIFNIVIQFIVYPFFQNKVGPETYGIILSLISLVSITPYAFGSAANYSRVINEKKIHPSNGDYNLFLIIGSVLSVGVGILYMHMLNVLNWAGGLIYAALTIFSTFRLYSDVEYRCTGNFVKFFWFYIVLTAGYLVGVVAFELSTQWALCLLIGEVVAVGFAAITTNIYRKPLKTSDKLSVVFKSAGFLFLSFLCENLTIHADRLVLLAFAGGTAVSIYYIASLFGKVIALLTTPVNAVVISYLVRSGKPLTKKMWTIFVLGGLVVSVVVLGGGILGSYIVLPLLYNELFSSCVPYLVPAILAQVLFFSSGVLLVVLLKFLGEKRQFLFNLCYCAMFFAFGITGAALWGLTGFVVSTLVVNALRFVVVMLWGYFAIRKNGIKLSENGTETSESSVEEGASELDEIEIKKIEELDELNKQIELAKEEKQNPKDLKDDKRKREE